MTKLQVFVSINRKSKRNSIQLYIPNTILVIYYSMNRDIQYNIKVNDGNSIQTISQLEAEVEGLNSALKYVKPNSEQFKELSKQVQGATKQLNKLNKEVEGISLEDKLDTADGAIKTLAGSTQALVGGFGLLGVESEKLAFLEGQAGNAIALGTGLKDLSEGFGKLAKSTQLASIAQKAYNVVQIAFNAIMSLNPLGILIISLTTVAALVIGFKDKIMDLIKSALGPFSGIIDRIAKGFQNLAESVGLADDAATKKTKNLIKSLDKDIRLAEAAGEKTLELQKKKLQEEAKLLKKGTDEYEENQIKQQVIDAKINKEKQDAQDAADKLADDKRKARNKKNAEERKKNADEALADAEKAKKDAEKAKKDAEQYEIDKENAIKEIRDANAITEQEQRDLELVKLQEDYQGKIELANKFGLDTTELIQSQREAEVLLQEEWDAVDAQRDKDKTQKQKDEADKRVADAIAAKEAQVAVENAKWGLLAQAASLADELAGQNEAVAIGAVIASQAAAVGQIISSTGLANAKAVAASPLTLGQPWVAINTISAGLSIASSVASAAKSIQQIKSSKGGGSVGGAPSLPRRGGGGGGAINAPQSQSNETTLSPIDIAEQQAQSQEPIKAYVLSGNARNAQEADAKIKSKRSVG